MSQLGARITVRMPSEMDADMRVAMRRQGVLKASDFVRQAVVRALAEQARPVKRAARVSVEGRAA